MRIWVTQPAPGPPRIGALIVVRQLQTDGHDAHFVSWDDASPQLAFGFSGYASASTVSSPDAWFVSVLGHRDWWSMSSMRARLRGAPIVLGGQCADLMRGWWREFGDVLAIGDIHAETRSALYAAIGSRSTDVVELGAAAAPPHAIRSSSGLMVFLATGCSRRCPYCRISWTHRYAETSADDATAAIADYGGRRVNLYSPSGDHPRMADLLDECRSRGKVVTNRDFHPRRALALIEGGAMLPGRIRIGVEGISGRLRRALRRPLSAEAW